MIRFMNEPQSDDAIAGLGEPSDETQSALRAAWWMGRQAAYRNRWPGLVMWIFGLAILGGYFLVPTIHEALNTIGHFKSQLGWKFSLVSTAVFGGLIPALVARVTRVDTTKGTWGFVIASTLLWAYKGVETDWFYQFQAWLFGASTTLQTIVAKTVCDQFVMVPLVGLVNVVLFYRWRDCGYSFRRLRSTLGKNWYGRHVLPVLIANWVVWIPAVAMIYSLPTALQLPVQNLILCFWVLILLFFTSSAPAAET